LDGGEMTMASVDFASIYDCRGSSLTSPLKRLDYYFGAE
jgi:hypothetical protein